MPKLTKELPESLTLRLSVEQRVYLKDVAELHEMSPSAVVRGLIDSARVDSAINRLEEVLPR